MAGNPLPTEVRADDAYRETPLEAMQVGFFIFVALVLVATCATSMLLSVCPSGSTFREELGHYLWGLLIGLTATLYAHSVYWESLSANSEGDVDLNPLSHVGTAFWKVVLPFVAAFTLLTLVRIGFVALVRYLRRRLASH